MNKSKSNQQPSIRNAHLISVQLDPEGNGSAVLLEFDRPVRLSGTTAALDLQVVYGPDHYTGTLHLAQRSPTTVQLSGTPEFEGAVPYAVFIPEQCQCLAVLEGGRVVASAGGFVL